MPEPAGCRRSNTGERAMAALDQQPIGQIVAQDLNTAKVFERHGMDYCCHGHQPLAAACQSHGVPLAQIKEELATAAQTQDALLPDANAMAIDELARYIVATHHVFTRQILPPIATHFAAVVRAHGERHPELPAQQEAFAALHAELDLHLQKEERVLFPYIEAMVRAEQAGQPRPMAGFGTVNAPIAAMISEHEAAGAILDGLHAETNGFQPPADACNTYRLLFKELGDLEQDLHRHIALENHLLFPKASALEARLQLG